MRPSRARRTQKLVHDKPEPPSETQKSRLRRRRVLHGDTTKADEGISMPIEKVIISRVKTPLVRSQPSLAFRNLGAEDGVHDMPSDTSLPSMGNGPKLTKTGRVSKARKGVKGAHRCACGKTYSRAEHLRRHQQNHEKKLPCDLCSKTFHRQDLYDRHIATKQYESLINANMSRLTRGANSDASHPDSRRDSATSGSLISSQPSKTSQTSTSNPFLTTTHVGSASEAQHPNVLQYSPGVATSEAPSRYTNLVTHQRTPCIAVSSDSFSIHDNSPFQPVNPASRSDASYSKDEPYAPTFFTDTTFAQLQATSNESHAVTFLATGASHCSSGDISPFSPFSLSASWAENTSIYQQTSLTEQMPFGFSTTSLTSPRIFSNTSMPTWLENGTDMSLFPTSAITSPSSSCAPAVAPVMMSPNASGAPYPLAFIAPHDKYGSLDLERPLEEQQLGIELSLKTKQHYLEAYWAHFDPVYPILHKAQMLTHNPLLTAAMMAIGAQYTYEPFARGDSRILHGKCLELITKYKSILSTGTRLDYMQAIFLVEVFSQFRAKRSPSQLSEVFLTMHDSLWRRHANTGRSYIESLSTCQAQLNDQQRRSQWAEWAVVMGFSRLLSACFVFESIQALTLARPLHSSATSVLDLFVPVAADLWDAPDHNAWTLALQAKPQSTVTISEALDKEYAGLPSSIQQEPFHSMVVTACYAASSLHVKQGTHGTPFSQVSPSHAIFEAANLNIVERLLCPHSNVLIIYNMVSLASKAPIKAILATSGESWILSQRLSQEALVAAAEFTALKTEMRAWTDTADSSFFQGPAGDSIRAAIQHSLTILRLCIDAPPPSLAFGADMALYHASLVLWALSFAAVSKATASGHELDRETSPTFEATQAQKDVKLFCDFAESALGRSLMDSIIPADHVAYWRSSLPTVLQWSTWMLGGADLSGTSVGELMQNAVGVLSRLVTRGWEGEWF